MSHKSTQPQIAVKPGDPALMVKLKNRRVTLIKASDGWALHCKRLVGRKVVKTSVGLSDEAMRAIVEMYVRLVKEA